MMSKPVAHLDLIFGATVALERKRLGLDQREFAKRLGMNQAALSRIECGKTAGKMTTILEVAGLLKISAVELTGRFEALSNRLEGLGVQLVAKPVYDRAGPLCQVTPAMAIAILAA